MLMHKFSAYVFLLAFLQMLVICFSNVSSLPNLTPSNFSIHNFLCHVHLVINLRCALGHTNK